MSPARCLVGPNINLPEVTASNASIIFLQISWLEGLCDIGRIQHLQYHMIPISPVQSFSLVVKTPGLLSLARTPKESLRVVEPPLGSPEANDNAMANAKRQAAPSTRPHSSASS